MALQGLAATADAGLNGVQRVVLSIPLHLCAVLAMALAARLHAVLAAACAGRIFQLLLLLLLRVYVVCFMHGRVGCLFVLHVVNRGCG
jgi:hypothetical protein